MEQISQNEAQAILSRLQDSIVETVYGAWDKLVREVLPLFPLCTIRFRRNAMYDLMIQKARPLFQDVRGVRLIETRRGRILLTIDTPDSHLILRFKKVDNHLKPANYPTQESLAFNDQEPNLPGIPHGVRLTVGYLMNTDDTELQGVYIICSKGNYIYWEYPITLTEQTPKVVVFPTPDSQEPEKRVRGKSNVADLQEARRIKGQSKNNKE